MINRARITIEIPTSEKERHRLPVNLRELFQLDDVNAPFATFTLMNVCLWSSESSPGFALREPGGLSSGHQFLTKRFVLSAPEQFRRSSGFHIPASVVGFGGDPN